MNAGNYSHTTSSDDSQVLLASEVRNNDILKQTNSGKSTLQSKQISDTAVPREEIELYKMHSNSVIKKNLQQHEVHKYEGAINDLGFDNSKTIYRSSEI